MKTHGAGKGRWVVCTAAVLAAAVAAQGADYYVSPKGDDGGSGAAAAPFRTIQKAADVVQPGDTVHLAAGVYDGRAVMKTSGTADRPIVFRGPADGEAVWTMTPPDPEGWDNQFACSLSGMSYITLERIVFRNCAMWLIMFDTHHCIVRDCTFDGSRSYNGVQLKNATYNRFLGCKFVRAIDTWTWEKMSEWCQAYPRPGADYIEVYFKSSNNLVEDCEFGAIQHVALSFSPFRGLDRPQRNIVRHCRFRDPRWKSLGIGGAEFTLVENNLFTGTAGNFVQMEASRNIFRRNVFAGYRLSPEAKVNHKNINGVIVMASKIDYRSCEFFCRKNRLFNNLFYDNEQVMSVYAWKEPFVDNLFKNNIFSRNGVTVFLPAPDPGDKNANYFVRNVFFAAPDAAKTVTLYGESMTLAEAAAKYPDLYQRNVETDPLLADPAAGDYGLREGSPCIDAAMALTTAVEAGEGTRLQVADALYFCDGNGLIEPDTIRIGDAAPVGIAAVDYDANTITLKEKRSWATGAAVNLDYAGAGPDIGPSESGAAEKTVFGPRPSK